MRIEPTAPILVVVLLSLSVLLSAMSLSSSRMRLMKAFLVMMSMSESMITALLGSKETEAWFMA